MGVSRDASRNTHYYYVTRRRLKFSGAVETLEQFINSVQKTQHVMQVILQPISIDPTDLTVHIRKFAFRDSIHNPLIF